MLVSDQRAHQRHVRALLEPTCTFAGILGERAWQPPQPIMLAVDDLTDFLWQMEIAVLEEAPLYEIPWGSRDGLEPFAVHHGPWSASTCAAVLRLWYEAGWIGLYFRDPPPGWNVAPAEWRNRLIGGEDLAAQDAYGLLERPERWMLEHADGHVQPYRTVEGEIAPREQWFEHVIETARTLLLKQ
ncbi:hypothetical protein [Actinoplanes aureus]|uniref:Uncharacterized protein n=1 Tax=Actinoplanes aureus TaxID=2792083 RepID=A0A931CG61_9ACTN|nr:hypothetical protein [Actinoplanes aureus]MBG0569315.1 hypothetical protein [Actinoplanes aureus]